MISSISLILAFATSASTTVSTVLLNILENILAGELTTISFPHTFRMGHFNYNTFYQVINAVHNKLTRHRA